MESLQVSSKQCGKCQKVKPFNAFNRSQSKDGYHFWCKPCRKEYNKASYKPNPTLARRKHLKRAYGLTDEQYQGMFAAQHGVCASCGQAETTLDSRTHMIANLHVDHDHKTGKVRALRCRGCNTAYGQLNEDPERIRLLLRYAENCLNKEA